MGLTETLLQELHTAIAPVAEKQAEIGQLHRRHDEEKQRITSRAQTEQAQAQAAFEHALKNDAAQHQRAVAGIASQRRALEQILQAAGGTYNPMAAPPPVLVDPADLNEQLRRFNDTSFSGFVKRTLGTEGYSTADKMYGDLVQKAAAGMHYWDCQIRTESDRHNRQKQAKADATNQRVTESKNRATQQLGALHREYRNELAALSQGLEAALVSPEISSMSGRLQQTYTQLHALPYDSGQWEPQTDAQHNLLLGRLEYQPGSIDAATWKKISGRLFCFPGDAAPTIPFALSLDGGAILCAEYTPDTRAMLMEGLRSMLVKLLRSVPLESVSLTYIDPIDRGGNLALLHALAKIPRSQLCPKVYVEKESIRQRLKELNTFVDESAVLLRGEETVQAYNSRENNAPLPLHWVVLNDFPTGLDAQAMETLAVLVNNAARYGIGLLFTCARENMAKLEEFLASTQNKTYTKLFWQNGTYNLNLGNIACPMALDTVSPTAAEFVETYVEKCKTALEVSNDYSSVYQQQFSARDASVGFRIPFAVDERGNAMELMLGTADTTNALISGNIGSGKSTLLHAIITGVITSYSPEEVQIWLVDYKRVEFAEYCVNTPPHIKLVGLEKSPEFTYSLLDALDDEFQNRLKLFASALGTHASSLREYNEFCQKNPEHKPLPRILLIVDEFHVMSQLVDGGSGYKTKLENILSEYRAPGLSCILCDQAVSTGLRGLTDKARKQILVRLAMRNDLAEAKETLSSDSSVFTEDLLNDIRTLGQGDVMYSRLVRLGGSASVTERMIDRCKVALVTGEDRRAFMPHLNAYWKERGTEASAVIVDGNYRVQRSTQDIVEYDQQRRLPGNTIRLHLGKPVNFAPCFAIDLRRRLDQNLMVMGGEAELRWSILANAVHSAAQQGARVLFFYDEDGDTLLDMPDAVPALLEAVPGIQAVCGADAVGSAIEKLLEELTANPGQQVLAVFSGIETMWESFQILPPAPARKTAAAPAASPRPIAGGTTALDALVAKLDSRLSEMGVSPEDIAAEESRPFSPDMVAATGTQAFDARPLVKQLFATGPRLGVRCVVELPTVRDLTRMKEVPLENFLHKIAFDLSDDNSMYFLGRSQYFRSIDEKDRNSAGLYHWGSNEVNILRPYLVANT